MNNRAVAAALENFLRLHACDASSVLVAFSGGPDSTALLSALAELGSAAGQGPAAELGLAAGQGSAAEPLHACWIDHGIRPARELAAEEAFVRGLAERLGVTLYIRRAERGSLEARAAKDGGVEAAARRFRYGALREVKDAQGLRFILTGHHADDQWETQVMRFFTGSGGSGLRGMQALSRDIGRPFLRLRRSQLVSYLNERGLPLNQDSTNAASDYLRNRLRHELMPAIASVFPGYGTGLNALSQKLHDDERALEAYAAELFTAGDPTRGVALARYKAAPRAVRHRVLFAMADAALRALPPDAAVPGRRVPWHLIQDIDAKLERAADQAGVAELASWQGLSFSLSGGAVCAKTARQGGERIGPSGYCAGMGAPGTFRIGKSAYCTVYYNDEGKGLRLDAFSWPLIVRARKPGDRIRNAVGWKALDKLLAELGLTLDDRDLVPVLEDSSGIVALLASALGYKDVYRYNADLITRAPPGYLGIAMKGIAEDYATRR